MVCLCLLLFIVDPVCELLYSHSVAKLLLPRSGINVVFLAFVDCLSLVNKSAKLAVSLRELMVCFVINQH